MISVWPAFVSAMLAVKPFVAEQLVKIVPSRRRKTGVIWQSFLCLSSAFVVAVVVPTGLTFSTLVL